MNHRRQWDQWLRTRPAIIRVMGRRLKPWKIYRLRKTGQLARLYSFSEDGTVKAFVWREDFGPALGHHVFGLRLSDFLAALPPSPAPATSMENQQ